MSKKVCEICGREIDSRGMSGHMKTHSNTSSVQSQKGSQHKIEPKESDTDGVISYPSNEQEIKNKTQAKHPLIQNISEKDIKKQELVKKSVVSKTASEPASKSGPRGQLKTETEHKEEWQGLFRE